MNQAERWVDNLFTRHRWIIHVFFWMMILGAYVIFFGQKNSNYVQTFFFVGLLMPVTIGTTYFLNYYLVPRYLMNGKHLLFILYFIYTLIASLYLEMMIVLITFFVLAGSKVQNMSPASVNILYLLFALLMVVFLSLAIKMLLFWRKSREDYQKLMAEKIETELKFLKTQLHPHFLFNTLNNLYYLALEKSDKTPDAILALSELLDYVLHGTKSNFVLVAEELQQVQNYIALEALRYQDRLTVTINQDKIEGRKIAPMILITLMENAFKHGVMKTNNKVWIELSLTSDDEYTFIRVRNSIGSNKSTETKSGIGLQNLKSQIDHIYHDKAKLFIEQESDAFCVDLQLKNNVYNS
jgi:sensor histidine kinase YesM